MSRIMTTACDSDPCSAGRLTLIASGWTLLLLRAPRSPSVDGADRAAGPRPAVHDYDRTKQELVAADGIEPVRYWPAEIYEGYAERTRADNS